MSNYYNTSYELVGFLRIHTTIFIICLGSYTGGYTINSNITNFNFKLGNFFFDICAPFALWGLSIPNGTVWLLLATAEWVFWKSFDWSPPSA